MAVVFICHPFQNKKENAEKTRRFCKLAIDAGHVPFSPALLYPQFLDESKPEQRRKGLECGMIILMKCDSIWKCSGTITEGMQRELDFAVQHDIPIHEVRCNKK